MVMLASASMLTICFGVLCLTDTELAWQFYQWDCRLMNMTPPRWANWQARVKQAGYALISLGIIGLMVSIGG